MPISIIVAERSRMAGELLSAALNHHRKHFDVVTTVCSSQELLEQVAEHHPQLALISLELEDGPTSGLKAARALRASNGSPRVIMLLDCSDSEKVIAAFSAGAKGVVVKTSPLRGLRKCLRCVHAGQTWADSTQLQWVCEALEERERPSLVSAKGAPLLTKREEQIVHLVADGLPNPEISAKLGVTEHTVKNHLFRIYEKLGISNRVELVLYVLSQRGSPLRSGRTSGEVAKGE